jgi:hypothetical protein
MTAGNNQIISRLGKDYSALASADISGLSDASNELICNLMETNEDNPSLMLVMFKTARKIIDLEIANLSSQSADNYEENERRLITDTIKDLDEWLGQYEKAIERQQEGQFEKPDVDALVFVEGNIDQWLAMNMNEDGDIPESLSRVSYLLNALWHLNKGAIWLHRRKHVRHRIHTSIDNLTMGMIYHNEMTTGELADIIVDPVLKYYNVDKGAFRLLYLEDV